MARVINRGGRPKQADVQQRVDHLLEVATELFIDQGYSGTSIDAIANKARAGKQTIYSRFADKADLFVEVVKRSLENQLSNTAIDSVLQGNLEQGLFEWARYILGSTLQPRFIGLYKLLLSEGPRFPEISNTFIEVSSARYLQPLESFIESKRNAEENYIFSTEKAALIFLYLMNGYIIRYALENWPQPSPEQVDEHALEACKVFLHGLAASHQGAPD